MIPCSWAESRWQTAPHLLRNSLLLCAPHSTHSSEQPIFHVMKITSSAYKSIWRLPHVAKCLQTHWEETSSTSLWQVILLIILEALTQTHVLPITYPTMFGGAVKALHDPLISELWRQVLELKAVRWPIASNTLPKNWWKKSDKDRGDYLRSVLKRADDNGIHFNPDRFGEICSTAFKLAFGPFLLNAGFVFPAQKLGEGATPSPGSKKLGARKSANLITVSHGPDSSGRVFFSS